MALNRDAEVSESDSRTYNLIKDLIKTCYRDEHAAGIYLARRTSHETSDFIGYRAAVVCTEREFTYAIRPVIADSRSEALRLLLEAVEVEMETELKLPALDGHLERLNTVSVVEDTDDVCQPGRAARKGDKRTDMGRKSAGKKDEEAVASDEDDLAHVLREAHVPKARRGAITRRKAPLIDLSDSEAEEPILGQRNLRSGTKAGERKRKREGSADESDQETDDDSIVVVSKCARKQVMKAPDGAGVKRGGKRGGRGGGRGKGGTKA